MIEFFLQFVLGDDTGTTDPTGPSGGDETDLATSRGSSLDSGGLTNMLMVTTTVGMLDGVHSNTTNLKLLNIKIYMNNLNKLKQGF